MDYLIADAYYKKNAENLITELEMKINASSYLGINNSTVGNSTDLELFKYLKSLPKQKLANYNMAYSLCKISKRQLIGDADSLSKELNIPFLSNYVIK
jgi:hypothetical protein